jgi:hypothetical protein
MKPKSEITPETLMAYADGELDPVSAKRVEKAVAADPALAEQVEKHRALKATLRAHFDPLAAEPAPDRFAAMIRKPAEVVELRTVREARKAKAEVRAKARPVAANSNWWRYAGGVAAALVFGVVLGVTSRPDMGGQGASFATKGGQLAAQGEMARALDSQLASKDGFVRLSFRNRDGEFCRVFDAGGRSGVACRDTEGWAIRSYRADGPATKTEYRQAGSAAAMADAQDMMEGAPLDAAAEKAAMGKGWR